MNTSFQAQTPCVQVSKHLIVHDSLHWSHLLTSSRKNFAENTKSPSSLKLKLNGNNMNICQVIEYFHSEDQNEKSGYLLIMKCNSYIPLPSELLRFENGEIFMRIAMYFECFM